MSEKSIDALRENSAKLVILGVILILLGILAITIPLIPTLLFAFSIGWLILLTGIAQLVYAYQARKGGGYALRLIAGILGVLIGLLLVFNPIPGVITLSLLLMLFLIVGGIIGIIGGLLIKEIAERGSILFGGIISLGLGLIMWSQWPISAEWVIGLIIGIVIFIQGWTMLMTGMKARGMNL